MALAFALTSTSRVAGRIEAARRAAARCALAAVVALTAGAASAVAQDPLSLTLTAVSEEATVRIDEAPTPLGPTGLLLAEFPLAVDVDADPGQARQAILLVRSGDRPVATITLDSARAELRTINGAAMALTTLQEASPGAMVDVRYIGDGQTAVAVPGAVVLLARGALRATRTDGGVELRVGEGSATVYSGELPAGGAGELQGRQSVQLTAGGGNAVTVAADGTMTPAQAVEGIQPEMADFASGVVQRSALPFLVSAAEEVTEGDIEPPTRDTGIPVATVAPEVRIPQIVPRGSLATQVITGSQSFATTAVQATAESFIGSGQAALAVVGARFQRTRITATGRTGSAPLSVNRELTRLFQIGPAR